MYNHKGYIYSFNSDDFYGKEKYPNANLNPFELASNKSVLIENVEILNSVYEKIIEMDKEGLIKIYHYPNRVEEQLSVLIDKTIYYYKEHNKPIKKDSFNDLLFYHPNLKEEINKRIEKKKINIPYISNNDIYNIFIKNKNNDLYENALLILKEYNLQIYNMLNKK